LFETGKGSESQCHVAHRVQLDFSDAGFNELTSIKEQSGSATNAGTIRNALALYKWYLETTKTGGDVLVRGKDGELERVKFVMSQ
jgi:hypothetical protein